MLSPLHPWDLTRIVVAVDPAVSYGEGSDDTGIVVAAKGKDGDGYVLDDLTCHLSPDGWAKKVSYAYRRWSADRVIAEANNGGELVRTVLSAAEPGLPLTLVHAARGKQTRAEPVAALFEQGRVHLVGSFPELEDELCVAGGTFIRTDSGDTPVELVTAGDIVWTRAGWSPVLWAGQTGTARCMEIATSAGHLLRCTPKHPVWIEGRGFRPAAEVQSLDRCRFLLPANSSSIAASNTFGRFSPRPETSTGTQHESGRTAASLCSSTECFTQRPTERFRTAGTSITRTGTGLTTTSTTSSRSDRPTMSESTYREVSGPRLLRSAVSDAPGSGLGESHTRPSASRVGPSSLARASEPCSALASVVAVTTPAYADTEPVYNLKVAGLPEFFANGLLVHNCTWVPGDSDSPDRLDALVWAFTELMVGGSGVVPPDFEFFAERPTGSRWTIQ